MPYANFDLSCCFHQCLFPGFGCSWHVWIQSFPGLQSAEYALLRKSAEVRDEGSCSWAGRWPPFFLLYLVAPSTRTFILSGILQWELSHVLWTSHCHPSTPLRPHVTLLHPQTLGFRFLCYARPFIAHPSSFHLPNFVWDPHSPFLSPCRFILLHSSAFVSREK